jgi:hypothetical protein
MLFGRGQASTHADDSIGNDDEAADFRLAVWQMDAWKRYQALFLAQVLVSPITQATHAIEAARKTAEVGLRGEKRLRPTTLIVHPCKPF